MTLTRSEIEREIARLRRVMRDWELEGRLDADVEDEMLGEIEDLQGDLYAITDAEADCTGGLNVPLFTAAMGCTPEEIFGEDDPPVSPDQIAA